jgi:cell division protein FtsA
MKSDQPILILDIGSGSVKALVGYELSSRPVVLHTMQSSSLPVFQGESILNPQILATAIKRLVTDVETHMGDTLAHIEVVIPSLKLKVYHGEKTTNTVDPHGSIHAMDIQNLHSMFQKEVVKGHVTQVCLVPVAYTVDGQKVSINPPIGEITSNILLQAYVQYIHKTFFESIQAVFQMVKIPVKRFILDGQGMADLMLTHHKDLPSAYWIVDHGANATSLHLISHHQLIYTHILDTGADQLTSYLSTRFGLTLDNARSIKEKFGFEAREPMFNGLVMAKDNITIRQGELNQALKEFYDPFLEELNECIRHVDVDQKEQDLSDLPIYLVGGGAQLNGIQTLFSRLGIGQGFTLPFVKTVGARTLKSMSTLGGLRFAHRYKIIEDDVRRPIQIIRQSKTNKPNFTNYDEE